MLDSTPSQTPSKGSRSKPENSVRTRGRFNGCNRRLTKLSVLLILFVVVTLLVMNVHSRSSRQLKLYEVLEVSPTATQREIKKAFHRLSRQYHPDHSPPDKIEENQEKYSQIAAAYDVLSDPEKRKKYDVMGDQPAGGSGAYYADFPVEFSRFGRMSFNDDFFGDVFGSNTRKIMEQFATMFSGESSKGTKRGGHNCITQTTCSGSGCTTITKCS